MKEWMEPIDSELPLAKAFNRIISDLELLRIMTNPRIFSDSTDNEAPFRMQNYYLTVLWERWLHMQNYFLFHHAFLICQYDNSVSCP